MRLEATVTVSTTPERTRFDIARSPAELRPHVPAWIDLARSSAQAATFLRPEWLLPFIDAFAQGERLSIVLAWRGARLVGLFPFVERSLAPLPVPGGRSLVYLQDDHTAEADVLVDARLRVEVLGDFLDWITAERGIGAVLIDRVPAASPNYEPLSALLRQKRFYVHEASYWASSHLEVRGSFDEFLKRQSKNFRKQVKKALRAGDAFEERVDLVKTPDELAAVLPELERVSAASWQGKEGTGTFSSPAEARFYRESCRAFAQSGLLRIFVCRSRGDAVGFVLCIAGARELEALKSEFVEEKGDMMTGWLIYREAYTHAAGSGLEDINSGSYRTDFKERWTSFEVDQLSLQIFPPTVAGTLRFLPHFSKEVIKRAMDKPTQARVYPLMDSIPASRRTSRPPPPPDPDGDG